MNKNNKLKLIKKFYDLSHEFDDVLQLPEDVVNFKPFDDAWTIKEQVVHCLDVDIANFHRYRWGIAEPGTEMPSFSRWTEKLNYQASDIKTAVELIKLIRKFMFEHLQAMIEDDWNNYNYIIENRKLNLEDAVQAYIEHVDFHRKLIDRNLEMFKKRPRTEKGNK
jgi:hypothetical protein